ncbi:MAG: sugar phosphate isomerase/epimerase family protein [Planctomycetota bacterium]
MISRRQFLNTTACLVTSGLSGIGCSASYTSPPKPCRSIITSYGLKTSVRNSDLVRDAGGTHIEDSVKNLLVPQKTESEFAERSEALLDGKPLPVVSCVNFLPSRLKAIGPEADTEAVLAWARITFQRAAKLSIPIIVFGSGKSRLIPKDFSKDLASRQMIALMSEMGDLAADSGITVAIEPLEPAETNFLNTLHEAREIIEAVDHSAVRFAADFYHMGKSCSVDTIPNRSVPG